MSDLEKLMFQVDRLKNFSIDSMLGDEIFESKAASFIDSWNKRIGDYIKNNP